MYVNSHIAVEDTINNQEGMSSTVIEVMCLIFSLTILQYTYKAIYILYTCRYDGDIRVIEDVETGKQNTGSDPGLFSGIVLQGLDASSNLMYTLSLPSIGRMT